MIINRITGGLGNQMFQYATGRALAMRKKTAFKLDISGYARDPLRTFDLHIYDLRAEIATADEILALRGRTYRGLSAKIMSIVAPGKLKLPKTNIQEEGLAYHPKIHSLPDNVYLDGYWQSEKYFRDAAPTIRKELTLTAPIDEKNKKFLNQIQATISVSLHVRRTDYVTNAQKGGAMHAIVSLDYYRQAISYIKQHLPNPTIFVFSDDHQWVKDNLTFDLPTVFVDCNDSQHAQNDLRLMSACQHHIIANSSFSWWGAWLAEHPQQIVIAPKNWFNDGISSVDLVPERWIRL